MHRSLEAFQQLMSTVISYTACVMQEMLGLKGRRQIESNDEFCSAAFWEREDPVFFDLDR